MKAALVSGVLLPSGKDEAAFIRKTCSEILKRQPKTTIGIICRSGWRRKPIDTEFASSDTPHVRWDLALDDGHVINLIKASVTRLGGNPSAETLKADVLSNIASEDVDTAADVIDALEQLAQLAEETGSIIGALPASIPLRMARKLWLQVCTC